MASGVTIVQPAKEVKSNQLADIVRFVAKSEFVFQVGILACIYVLGTTAVCPTIIIISTHPCADHVR
jgi:hypothetical protein